MTSPYKTVIGLEVHVQLLTKSKLFCRCSTEFGNEPNTQTCPVCAGLPGTLPVINKEAYRLSVITALALNCNIPHFTKWDRKNYYYPDLPKGYQISQFDLPMSEEGFLELWDPKEEVERRKIGIIRAHLEEDAGKSMHDEVAGKSDSRIDLNRTGTPLLEIVSHPHLHTPAEAKAYLTELKLLLTYLAVSDCNMQEGSLRVDANVNLHIEQDGVTIATPIVEIKNVNSFRAVERAIAYEAERQYDEWLESGKRLGDVPKQTRGWDDQAQVTKAQREKEDLGDYRYFPDPDLVPVTTTDEEIASIRNQMGELPAAIRARLESNYELTAYAADVLVNQGRGVVNYFLEVADSTNDYRAASNWTQQEVLRLLNEREISIEQFPVKAAALTDLIQRINSGELDKSRAKDVFGAMADKGIDASTAISELGIVKVDQSAVLDLARELLEANPKIVADYKAGKQQSIGALIGQAKARNPNINPGEFRKLLIEAVEQL